MAGILMVNARTRGKTCTKKRRKSSLTKRRGKLIRSSTKRTVKTYRRNPSMRSMSNAIIETGKAGAIGSIGALAGTVVGNFLPLPDKLTGGAMAPVVNALVGIATGFVVGKFANKKIGLQMAQGAVTVALYDTFKNGLQKVAPNLNLSGYDETLLGYDESLLGAYDTIGAYETVGASDPGRYDDTGMGYSGAGFTGDVDDI